MNRAKWITIIFATMLLAAPACKKGVNTASDPIKKQAEEHYTNARRLFLTCDPDKYTDAIKEYQLALNLWDEYPEALAGVAEAISMWRGYSMTEQEFGEAYKYAQRALRLNPELPAGYRAMADLSRHRHDYERALRQIDMALKIEPDNAEDLYVKGSSLLDSDPKAAHQILLAAKKNNPDLPKIYFNLASAAQKMGSFDEALSYLEKYQGMVPSDISAYCSMGMIYLDKQGEDKSEQTRADLYKEAADMFNLAIAKSDFRNKPWQVPWVLMAYKALARMDMDKNKFPEALEELKKAEKVYDPDVELQYLFGVAYKKTGDKKLAKEHLQKALILAPENKSVQEELKGL